MIIKTCKQCGREFRAKESKRIYCCRACYVQSQRISNEIEHMKDFANIIINSPKYGIFRVKIDIEDIPKVKGKKWCVGLAKSKKFYVANSWDRQRLSRLITNCPEGLDVDHINHDTLDNRKCNLRCITRQANCQNKEKQYGVWYDEQRKGWHAQIGVNYQRIELGVFTTYNKALQARLKAEKVYYNRYTK